MKGDTDDALPKKAKNTAFVLYEGKRTPHRSCGIALAETFGLATPAYQSLRRGGVTGCGECGAIVAGRLILGELLGDPNPTGAVTPELLAAAKEYEAMVPGRVDRGDAPGDSIVCNTLTGQFEAFHSEPRLQFCTRIASEVAEMVTEVALAHGVRPNVTEPPGEDDA